MQTATIDARNPRPFLVFFSNSPTTRDVAREFVPRVHDLTPFRDIPRTRVAPDLPRTKGRHPRLRGATLEQLQGIARYRKRDGRFTIYARRAATAVLRAIEKSEQAFRRELQSPFDRLQRFLDRASQLRVMLRASQTHNTPAAIPGTLVPSASGLPQDPWSHRPCRTATPATVPYSPRRSSPQWASHPPPWPM